MCVCPHAEPNHRCPGGPAERRFARDLQCVFARLRSEGKPAPHVGRYFHSSHLATRVQLAVRRDRTEPKPAA